MSNRPTAQLAPARPAVKTFTAVGSVRPFRPETTAYDSLLRTPANSLAGTPFAAPALGELALAINAQLVINAHGTVLWTDPQCTLLALEASTRLRIENGVLGVAGAELVSPLRRAIREALPQAGGGFSCLAGAEFGFPITLHGMRLGVQQFIFVRVATVPSSHAARAQIIGKAWGFTRSERRVLGELMCRHSPEDVAQNLGVALSTVRSHVRNMLVKSSSPDLRYLLLTIQSLV